MRIRRLALAGLGLATALLVGVGGCGTDAGGNGSSSDKAADSASQQSALEALTAAGKKLGEDTFKMQMTLTDGVTATGVIDPAGKKSSLTLDFSDEEGEFKIDAIVIGDDAYVKLAGMPMMPDKWMHLTGSSANSESILGRLKSDDPTRFGDLSAGLITVERDGDRGFKGTIDLTKTKETVDEETVKALGDKASAVPFTAKVDDQGRLVEMVIDMSAIDPKLGKMTTTYSDFGAPVDIKAPPASEIMEAPEGMLDAPLSS
ncbi:MAG TPA: hypothetical protein VF174_06605 [Micromonosporaceae bacterium]